MIPNVNSEWAGSEILPGQGLWGGRLIIFNSLGSTNSWVKNHLDSLGNGDVVAAWEQTSGRGRFSRHWITPAGGNIALSLVLEKPDRPEKALILGQAAALAVVRLLENLGIRAALKWPNDVLVRDRKIAGILAEAASSSEKVVIGVGLNINLTIDNLKDNHLERQATSIFLELGQESNVEEILPRLLLFIEEVLTAAGRREEESFLAHSWEVRDALRGKEIEIAVGSETWRGHYQGMDDMGRLILKLPPGENKIFWSGEVQKVRESGNL